ncbi:conserved hypothetical protein [Ricinus communis]|uniref:Uncharacterized protein n=1 Tax=Ricinus communis TaxID=3988 RepID=B9T121_RICCO|nr:conserved hypothetical protein [Ricinus communis]
MCYKKLIMSCGFASKFCYKIVDDKEDVDVDGLQVDNDVFEKEASKENLEDEISKDDKIVDMDVNDSNKEDNDDDDDGDGKEDCKKR